jgi:membrane protein DedA with SNARE-associated domain
MKVPYLKFLAFDGFAALISVPLFVWLGYWIWATFGEDIAKLEKALARTHALSLWVAIGLGLVLLGFLVFRWRRSAAKDKPAQ